MESAIETVIAVGLFILVFIWSILSITTYISVGSENSLKAILTEYAIEIKNRIINDKNFDNPSTNPSDYGINSKIFILIEIKEFVYTYDVILTKDKTFPSNFTLPKFLDKGETIGAYSNDSLIIVKVTVYGLP
jgi:hypothetical protein